jgi:carnitine 3-dehydrogenase
MPSSRRRPRASCPPTCRRRCNIPNACWWGIRSTRFTCCRWWNWSAARKPRPAFIADRLLEAIWRESLWLVKDGIATTRDIDDAVRYGFGLRYAQMGVFDTYRVAGGEAGMRHFMEQFGPCLKWPWTKLTDVPEFTDELVDLIAGQSDEQSGYMGIREMERIRDDNLIAILQALKGNNWGAGQTLARYEKQLFEAANDD